ncbi:TetR family transcriptional regulator [Natranaerovirga hydrolytica]|uniref:TetR family transcriptional regulator n=1 Tax=Natranaerovirga hydrolytica TaxID=680378 RepID=A0A4R1N0S8_9FIRM|nr:TetR/AcrR family transcriptional regulator [Natranaerovirga hydrolytica]TCK98520.1 TetR family transcriptional regulator [Natranaerovirga hydrolytica]
MVNLNSLSTSDKILYAAMEIISQEGLKGLTASKLAKIANISKSTVFHYYKSMDDIPALVLKTLYSEIFSPLEQVNYNSVYDYLNTVGLTSFSKDEQQRLLYKAFLSLYQESMHNLHLKEIVNICSKEFALVIYTQLRALIKGTIEDSQVKNITQLIFMTLDGICLHYLINGNQQEALTSWELFITALIKHYNLD